MIWRFYLFVVQLYLEFVLIARTIDAPKSLIIIHVMNLVLLITQFFCIFKVAYGCATVMKKVIFLELLFL